MKRLIYLSAFIAVAALVSTGCKKKGPEPVFSVSKVTLTDVPVAGKTETVTITSNVAWSIAGATEWCTVTPKSGEGNGTVTIEVAANEEADSRSTTLKISAEGFATVDIPVSQSVDNVLNAITDPAFKKWADTKLAGGTGRLSSADAAKVESIEMRLADDESLKNIKSLEGIQNFTALKTLDVIGIGGNNQLDIKVGEYISGLENLEEIYIHYNIVTETLNTKAMPKLKTLHIGRSPNLTLELGEHLLLETASFEGNTKLTSVSFNGYSHLTTLNTYECPLLETVTVADCAKLEILNVSKNPKLTTLSVENCPSLVDMFYYNNAAALESATINGLNGLTALNLHTSYPELKTVSVTNCAKLETLNVSKNPKLAAFSNENCPELTYLYINEAPALESVTVKDLNIKSLAIDNRSELKTLSITNCAKIDAVNVSNDTKLAVLSIKNCPELINLYRSNIPALTSLTLDGLTKLASGITLTKSLLSTVSVSHCGVTKLEVSNNAELTTVNVSDCEKLETLNVSQNPKLTTLSSVENFPLLSFLAVYDTGLEVLTMKNLPALIEQLFWTNTKFKEVTIQNIGLAGITMKDRAELAKFTVNDCPELANLTFSGCPKLEDFNCSKNAKLKTLSITGSDAIKKLRVNNTIIGPTIDISSYKSLTEFDCSNTSVTTVNTYWEPGKKPASVTTYNIGNATEVKK